MNIKEIKKSTKPTTKREIKRINKFNLWR